MKSGRGVSPYPHGWITTSNNMRANTRFAPTNFTQLLPDAHNKKSDACVAPTGTLKTCTVKFPANKRGVHDEIGTGCVA